MQGETGKQVFVVGPGDGTAVLDALDGRRDVCASTDAALDYLAQLGVDRLSETSKFIVWRAVKG